MKNKHTKYSKTLIATLAILSLSMSACAGDKQTNAEEKPAATETTTTQPVAKKAPNEKVASVNSTVITQGEVDAEIDRIKQQYSGRGMTLDEEKLQQIAKDLTENLITTELLFQKSKSNGIKVEEKAVNAELDKIKKQFKDDADFKAELAKMNFSEDSLRAQITKGLTIQQLVKTEVADKIEVSDKDVEEYYKNNPAEFTQAEKIHASHILVKVEPTADATAKEKARKKIEEVQEKIKKGEDFAELAKKYSEGPSAPKGGDLGYFEKGRMVKPFEEAVWALKPNEVSNIVETQFGYHIIKAFEKKPETKIPFDSIKPSLQKHLKQSKVRESVTTYIDGLKKEAKIERF